MLWHAGRGARRLARHRQRRRALRGHRPGAAAARSQHRHRGPSAARHGAARPRCRAAPARWVSTRSRTAHARSCVPARRRCAGGRAQRHRSVAHRHAAVHAVRRVAPQSPRCLVHPSGRSHRRLQRRDPRARRQSDKPEFIRIRALWDASSKYASTRCSRAGTAWPSSSRASPKTSTLPSRPAAPIRIPIPRCAAPIQNSRNLNMPKDKVEAAIKRASGKDATSYEQIIYEGYAPHGVAVIVEAATDNPTRTGRAGARAFSPRAAAISAAPAASRSSSARWACSA